MCQGRMCKGRSLPRKEVPRKDDNAESIVGDCVGGENLIEKEKGGQKEVEVTKGQKNLVKQGKDGDEEVDVEGGIYDFNLAADIGKSLVEETADEHEQHGTDSEHQDELPISVLLDEKLKKSDKEDTAENKRKKPRSASKRIKAKFKYIKSPYEA
ncbi:hypothetical protein LINPERPRIM_LOCUS8761, partial [Linum perenne]